ncbi:sulfite exporter TauE/SafE family protein [Meridianimarinicoccus sp. MJW13]|uniref:sulfite exporter TauE/SafE family protein n=1 Tax=Meridianimarinicoccus sp. MJW13 TaxID=2720031 RepID=UPI0018679844|nr:sulfite exporter TauE/SafE family protein [Fluviibacterium sp. MJW13]
MDSLYFAPSPLILGVAVLVTLVASFVKGAIGFAMPMIMISGLASFLPAEPALAALLMPTLVSNLWQAFRGGLRPALQSAREYRVYLGVLLVVIALSAQLVRGLPQGALFLTLGLVVTVFALVRVVGLRLHVPPHRRRLADVGIGTVAGFSGGLAGVWGPPTVMYLAAVDAPKVEAIRVQGVVYLAGAIVLVAAHLRTGVFNAQTAPLSFLLLVPMVFGMWAGQHVQDRLDQARFRKATLAVLVLAGLNLARRGLETLG